MGRRTAALLIAVLLTSAPAAAQSTSRPGPWALDLRGVTSPVPQETVFYPALDKTALIPSRGYGLDLGLHVYLLNLGPARLGIGADVLYVQAKTKPPAPAPSTDSTTTTTPTPAGQSVQLDMRMLAPQISFNFGSREGWSYLSAGLGKTDVISRTRDRSPGRRESSQLDAINVGGGARWFFKSHLAFGFDVRMHKIAAGIAGDTGAGETGTPDPDAPVAPPIATPAMRILTVAVGFSIK